ncbi:unnamed protein product [Penicillium salamii]|uniref:Zn(2)-C6 fungal-type domain-containing protein n=1 Tax=Penicillium salamii TaxID=1612424 RepID=A0A9W4JLP5_9EURO|nr:unnamed protein product [Penicillium salamii]
MTLQARISRQDGQKAQQRHQKRIQVARACDGCRLRRTKCDNQTPCSNCVTREQTCSNSGALKVSTLTQATEEIESLRRRVRQLEEELKQRPDHNPPTPAGSSLSPAFTPRNEIGGRSRTYWPGTQLRPARASNDTWLGPSSLQFFIQRLGAFLTFNLQQAHSTQHLLPISASDNQLLNRPTVRSHANPTKQLISPTGEPPTEGVYLNPIQEEYFINLFWQTFHTALFPIVDEAQFKEHYQSLWTGGKERAPSALVDIIIAMCMQYGISALPADAQGLLVEGQDALVAGRWHYWRGQTLLSYELESPSLSTLQCHLLCAVYLCGGSFHNMMNNAVGTAVCTAHMLGLHLDPPSDMSHRECEIRKRLWWAVYVMDSKSGMKLGRPFMLRDSHSMPSLPNDSLDAARTSGSMFAPIGDNATWLSFNLHQIKLYMKTRAAYTSYYDQDLPLSTGQTVWDDPSILEASAEVLPLHIQGLQDWVNGVPDALKLNRQNKGTPLSTDGTSLLIEGFLPPWLQRQRVLLELTYHHLSVNLYRPFISFSSRPQPGSLAEEIAMRCASHAITLSKITQQILAETSILDGWHEAFHSQWGAAMSLIGFIVVYPHASLTTEARAAVNLAVSVFDGFGLKFEVAKNAASIMRELCVKVDFLMDRSQLQLDSLVRMGSFDNSNNYPGGTMSHGFASDPDNGRSSTIRPETIHSFGSDFFDMAVDIDFWNDPGTLWPEFDDFVSHQDHLRLGELEAF